jgi:acetoin utilization protein AcuC
MLLVYGPRSVTYDFGPGHPLTPRRFGPGIDLLRAVGAEPGLTPEPAADEDLLRSHTRRYLDVVKRFSDMPYGGWEAGIGEGGDDPPFAGMHEAAAAVAGGSLRAMEAILRGDVEHAQHPGGGLHHAMADRAAGFCIYDDVALAIARARADGLRVLYLDLDVHHGDGVQAIHWDDPDVLTVSIHEVAPMFFPGTGTADEVGEGTAAGTAVNVPLPAGTGAPAWIAIVRQLLPELAAAFGADVVVSQHGADSHSWDPLAHLHTTTTVMGEAARLVDAIAHRHARGGWLATGGGGYDAYRVVPRAWALTWLAGAHREVPTETPVSWRERWAGEAARYGQAPLPPSFDDPELDAEMAELDDIDRRALAVGVLVRRVHVPRVIREAVDRGWYEPLAGREHGSPMPSAALPAIGEPTVVSAVDPATWVGLTLAERVVAPAAAADAHRLLGAALADGADVSAAIQGRTVVGLAVSVVTDEGRELLAVGVAPGWRGRGLATALLAAHPPIDRAEVTLAERDVVEPLPVATRAAIARRLLGGIGLELADPPAAVVRVDPRAIAGRRR